MYKGIAFAVCLLIAGVAAAGLGSSFSDHNDHEFATEAQHDDTDDAAAAGAFQSMGDKARSEAAAALEEEQRKQHIVPRDYASVELRPNKATFSVKGDSQPVTYAWQAPQQLQAKEKPAAVLVLFHGCARRAIDWFEYPLDAAVTRAAMSDYNMAVIAFDAVEQQRRCWAVSYPPSNSRDAVRVKAALYGFLRKRGWLHGVPVVGLGASSGGSFVTTFAHTGMLHAQAVYISTGVRPSVTPANCALLYGKRCPDTVFVHMPRDTYTSRGVDGASRSLDARGTKVNVFDCPARPLKPDTLAKAIPGLRGRTSMQVYNELLVGGFLSSQGMLFEDPRGSPWSELLLASSDPTVAAAVETRLGHAGMEEVLNDLYAQHEMTAQFGHAVLQFLLERGTARAKETAQRG